MYSFHVVRRLDALWTVVDGRCALSLIKEGWLMIGPSGECIMPFAHTSPERLAAHWAGFTSENRRSH